MAHAAEWGHWYSRTGEPVYEIEKADKSGMRPVTLRDARKLGLVPGFSGVAGCAAKPALDRWKVRQGILAALTLPRVPGESDDDYIERVVTDSQEQAKKAANKGTAIHAAIQRSYEGGGADSETWLYVRAAYVEVGKWMKGPWDSERSFANPMGYGGKVDLSQAWAVADFKTKEFGPDDELKTWDEQAMQLAAYRVGVLSPRARCAIVYVSVTNPGLARLIEIPEDDLQRGWLMFRALLAFWQHKNRYDSSFTLEPVAA